MQLYPLATIKIPAHRQRRDFDPDRLSDLASDIERNGLLNPITIREDGQDRVLVAGERRFKAIQMLDEMGTSFKCNNITVPAGWIPALTLGELDELPREEAELSENTVRVDLSWQERAEAMARLARLKEIQRPEATPGQIAESILPDHAAPGQRIREALLVTRHIAAGDTNVAKAKSLHDALKIIKKKDDAAYNTQLAAIIGLEATNERHSVYHADCLQWLRQTSDRFDCIVIDPPYGIGADNFGDGAGKYTAIDHDYKDGREETQTLLTNLMPLLWEVARPQSHIYVWCDIDLFHFIRGRLEGAGFWTHRTPLINIKQEGGRVPWPEHGPRRTYELVCYAVKGKRPVTGIYGDSFASAFSSGESHSGHGAAKPVSAYCELLKRSCKPGDRVLDCFAGSGTILEAGHMLGLRATAVEREASYYGLCVQRLQGLGK